MEQTFCFLGVNKILRNATTLNQQQEAKFYLLQVVDGKQWSSEKAR